MTMARLATGEKVCPDCGGSGVYGGKAMCLLCAGTGKVMEDDLREESLNRQASFSLGLRKSGDAFGAIPR